ncbi:triosephosphate isomerase [Longimycelium tulufanense]|uniref:Triosephosphate isomerase n=1 Tax=Longimycelium tulufanense TaxID=907463 RepID=A0A8J3FZT9_9PSEU|nr:triose-phosphate isomerase [Longimycelium tulufanense]GGM83755.1 triosephosphate isomerase [Longimycelium tulufanense]
MSTSRPASPACWIGTSWKMTKTSAEARTYAHHLATSSTTVPEHIQMFVVPPFTVLAEVATILADSRVTIGAQNAHWAPQGAYTGEISVPMVADTGATLVELGHSERRTHFAETDETVNRKVHAVLDAGLRPLVCVGEPWTERQTNTATEYVLRQVKIALSGVSAAQAGRVLFAYEPIWAIGEQGQPASPQQAEDMHARIRHALTDLYGAGGASIPVLYGGSVNPDNAGALVAQDHIDGLFVGRSAWTVDGYLTIIRQATEALGVDHGRK